VGPRRRDSKRLQLPTSGSTLADAEARYFWFDVLQDASPGFTPFDWEVDALANSVEIVATRNLERITFDPLPAGLATGAAMTVTTQAADGSADEVSVRSWSVAPSAVLRDGVATSSWTYHAPTATVTLQETDPAAHAWTIVP
jgi:hypothetical protein